MDKELKRQKKARQHERRVRALEDQVYKLQCLVKEQNAILNMQDLYIKELYGKQIKEQRQGTETSSDGAEVLDQSK